MIGLYFGSIAALYLFLRLWWLAKDKPSGKWYLTAASTIFSLVLFEVTANIIFYQQSGEWVFAETVSRNPELWEPDSELIGVNRKGVSVEIGAHTYTHNSQGYRGAYIQSDADVRVAAIGASTTYGIGVNDNETWPYYLDSLLGSRYEVINMGVPGYSTVEHYKQVNRHLKDLKPNVVILHVGLNDLRVSHVNNLKQDYSNFHTPGLYSSFGFCYLDRLPKLASLRAAVVILQKMGFYPICMFHQVPPATGVMSSELDETALSFYSQNMLALITACREYAPVVYVVPQVINEEKYQQLGYEWWIPYIKPEAIGQHFRAYNQVSKKIADSDTAVYYVGEVDSVIWSTTDFCDAVHLGDEGNLKIAGLIAKSIEESPLQLQALPQNNPVEEKNSQ